MKSLLICGNSSKPMKLNESESTSDRYILQGLFAGPFGVENRNKRIYEVDEYLKHLQYLRDDIKKGEPLLGELDHPDDRFEVKLKEASHRVLDLWYDKATNTIQGKIELLNTPNGKLAKSLVDQGIPLHISSRAAGTVNNDKTVSIQQIYTFDLVCKPGFAGAVLHRVNESSEQNGYTDGVYDFLKKSEKIDEKNEAKNFGILNEDVLITEMNSNIRLREEAKTIINNNMSIREDINKQTGKNILSEFEAGGNDWGDTYQKNPNTVSGKNDKEMDVFYIDLHTICSYFDDLSKAVNDKKNSKYFKDFDEDLIKDLYDNIEPIYGLLSNKTNVKGDEHQIKIGDIKEILQNLKNISNIDTGKLPISSAAKRLIENLNNAKESLDEADDNKEKDENDDEQGVEIISVRVETADDGVEIVSVEADDNDEESDEKKDDDSEKEEETEGNESTDEGKVKTPEGKEKEMLLDCDDIKDRKQKFTDKLDDLIDTIKSKGEKKKADEAYNIQKYPMSRLLNESNFAGFMGLKESQKNNVINYLADNGIADIDSVNENWKNGIEYNAETEVWLKYAPKEYRVLFEGASSDVKESIRNTASFILFENQHDINVFWENTGLVESEGSRMLNEQFVSSMPKVSAPVNEDVLPYGKDFINTVKEMAMTYNS